MELDRRGEAKEQASVLQRKDASRGGAWGLEERDSHPGTLQPAGLLGSRCHTRSESCLVCSRNAQEHRV